MRRRLIAVAAAAAALALSAAASEPREVPAVAVADLLRVADIAGLSASPDGKTLVFRVEQADLAANNYPTNWYAWSPERGIRSLGSGGEVLYVDPGVPDREPPVWSRDSAAIYFRALVASEVQLWRARLDGSGAAPVLSDDADMLSIAPARDGAGLTFTTGPTRAAIERAEREEYDSGILVDEHVDLAQNLFRGAIINGRPATQKVTGGWFSRGGILWREPVRARTLDFATLKVEEGDSGRAEAPPSRTRREPRAVSGRGDVAALPAADDVDAIEVRRAGGEVVSCRVGACTGRISWLAWTRDGEEVAFATQDPARAQSIFLWNLARNTVRPLARSEGSLSGGRELDLPCAVAAGALFCVAAEAASPPRLERIDLADGERTTVFDPNAELRSRLKLRVEHLRWRGAQGHEFTGTVLSAPGRSRARRPLFVHYYFCDGFLRGGLGDEWPMAPLALAGMEVVCVNSSVRGAPQDSLATYRTALEGVRAIVDRLAKEGRIDTNRVGMGGLSFGSEATLWVAYNSDLLAAASIASPGMEPGYYWINGVRGRENHKILRAAWKLGSPEEMPGRWRMLSAALNAEKIKAPLLMQLPEQEARMAIELYARITHTPTPVELYAFPHAPHIKVQPRQKMAVYGRNLDWFRYWLQGERDPSPLKRAQYERWDALRARQASLSRPSRSAATAPASPDRRPGSSEGRSAPAPAEGSSPSSPDR